MIGGDAGCEILSCSREREVLQAFVITAKNITFTRLQPEVGSRPNLSTAERYTLIYIKCTQLATAATTTSPPRRHMSSVAVLPATAHIRDSSRKVLSITRRPLRQQLWRPFSPRPFVSPTGLQPDQFFQYRFRLPARAVRSGGTNAPETRWRATTD